MARTRTLTLLLADVRMRAGMENSTFCTDAEITEYINQSIAELRDLIISAQGPEHWLSTQTINTVAGTTKYALASDFYELVAGRVTSGSRWKARLVSATIDDFDRVVSGSGWGWYALDGADIAYRIQGDNIQFMIPPESVYVVTLHYIAAATRLSGGSDTFDGFNGFEEWVILDAAIKCLQKEESDISFLVGQREKIEARIARMAGRRDAGGPSRIRDTHPRAGRLVGRN